MQRHGRNLMQYLTKASYHMIKREVDDMTVKEAADIWAQIEPSWIGVCARAGKGRVGMMWSEAVRKMSLIKDKAEGR